MNSACDIGCDVYGYPIREARPAAEHITGEDRSVRGRRIAALVAIYERVSGDLATYQHLRQPLSASWHHLACITAPPPRTMPARALAYRTQKIGLR